VKIQLLRVRYKNHQSPSNYKKCTFHEEYAEMMTKLEFEQVVLALQGLWAQDHTLAWEQGFLEAVEVFTRILKLSESRGQSFIAYAGLTSESATVRLTTAPADYDGLGTEHQATLGTNQRTKEVYRRVAITRDQLEWQENRYFSGGYVVFELGKWLQLVAEPWFAADFVPESASEKPKRDYMKNFKGKERNKKKVVENQ
jgi:hypothetical protein